MKSNYHHKSKQKKKATRKRKRGGTIDSNEAVQWIEDTKQKILKTKQETEAAKEKIRQMKQETEAAKEEIRQMKQETKALNEKLRDSVKPVWEWAADPPLDLAFGNGFFALAIRASTPTANLRCVATLDWPQPTKVAPWTTFDCEAFPMPNAANCPTTQKFAFDGHCILETRPRNVSNKYAISSQVNRILNYSVHCANYKQWIFSTEHTHTESLVHKIHGIVSDAAIINETNVRVVIEIKPWWTWNTKDNSIVGDEPDPRNLVDLWETGADTGGIRQMFTCMAANGAEYGILTTFKHWFFLKLEVDVVTNSTTLLASRPIPAMGDSPSLGHALLYFFHLFHESPALSDFQCTYLTELVRNATGGISDDAKTDDLGTTRETGGATEREPNSSGLQFNCDNDDTVVDHTVVFPVHRLLRPSPPFVAKLQSGRTGIAIRTKIRGIDAAIKIADLLKRPGMKTELLHEAKMYERLKNIQGTVIPRLLYVGPMTLCRFGLATSFQGRCFTDVYDEALEKNDLELVATLKQGAESCIESLHSYGIVHGDPRGSNFCVDSQGRVSLIDLANSIVLEQLEVKVQQEHKKEEWKQLKWQFEEHNWNLNLYSVSEY